MKKAFVFPGQGAQFVGMGKDLYENSPEAKELFEKANEIPGIPHHGPNVRGNRRRFKANQSNSTGDIPSLGDSCKIVKRETGHGSGSLAGRILRTCRQWDTFFRRWLCVLFTPERLPCKKHARQIRPRWLPSSGYRMKLSKTF